jgi:hypothetical protein
MAAKVLGQAAPAATTATDLYTVPSAKAAVCSTLAVCNRGATNASYRVAVRPAGATLANEHYIAYGTLLPASSSDAWTVGLTLTATDVVTVYASSADLSFSLFGDES